ncbi:hypothetical protein ACS0PU_002161 [Formica fusca]
MQDDCRCATITRRFTSRLIVRTRDRASRDCISVLNAFALSCRRELFARVNKEEASASGYIIQNFWRLIK